MAEARASSGSGGGSSGGSSKAPAAHHHLFVGAVSVHGVKLKSDMYVSGALTYVDPVSGATVSHRFPHTAVREESSPKKDGGPSDEVHAYYWVCLPPIQQKQPGTAKLSLAVWEHKTLASDVCVVSGTAVLTLDSLVASGSTMVWETAQDPPSLRMVARVEAAESFADKAKRIVYDARSDAGVVETRSRGWCSLFNPGKADTVERVMMVEDETPETCAANVMLENPPRLVGMYASVFAGTPHTLLVQDPSPSSRGNAAVIALLTARARGHRDRELLVYYAVVFAKSGIRYLVLPRVGQAPLSTTELLTRLGVRPPSASPDTLLRMFKRVDIDPESSVGAKAVADLCAIETPEPEPKVKLGVLLVTRGQTAENAMYSNNPANASPAYGEFLDLMGDRVRLLGFTGYAAQLDTANDGSGTHSYHVPEFLGHEVMYHVSTELQYDATDEQRIQRKRFIGNDIVVIVFVDDAQTPFSGAALASEYTNVVLVVSPIIYDGAPYYRVTVARKKGVPGFGPVAAYLYPRSAGFAGFLLTKAINGSTAVCRSPEFLVRERRTRATYLKLFRDALTAGGATGTSIADPWVPNMAARAPSLAVEVPHARAGARLARVLDSWSGHINTFDSIGDYVFFGTASGVYVFRPGEDPHLVVSLRNVIQIGVDAVLGVLYIRTAAPQDHVFAITLAELLRGEDPTVVMLTPQQPTHVTWGVVHGRNIVVVVVGRGEGIMVFDATSTSFPLLERIHMPSAISSVCVTERGLFVATTGERSALAQPSPLEEFFQPVHHNIPEALFLDTITDDVEARESRRLDEMARAARESRSLSRSLFRRKSSSGRSSSGQLGAGTGGGVKCTGEPVAADAGVSFTGTSAQVGAPACFFVDLTVSPSKTHLVSRASSFAETAVAVLRLSSGMLVGYPRKGVFLSPSGMVDRSIPPVEWTSVPKAFIPMGANFAVVYELYVEVYSGIAGALLDRVSIVVDLPNEPGRRGPFVTTWDSRTNESRIHALVLVPFNSNDNGDGDGDDVGDGDGVVDTPWTEFTDSPTMTLRLDILGGAPSLAAILGHPTHSRSGSVASGDESIDSDPGGLSPARISRSVSCVSNAIERAQQAVLSRAARRKLHKLRVQAVQLERWRRRRRKARAANVVSSLAQVGADATYVPPPHRPGTKSCRYCDADQGTHAESQVSFVDVRAVLDTQAKTGDPASYYADRLLAQLNGDASGPDATALPTTATALGGVSHTPLLRGAGSGTFANRKLDIDIAAVEADLANLDRILHFVGHSNLFPPVPQPGHTTGPFRPNAAP